MNTPYTKISTLFLQLQAAFERGDLKPGLNVEFNGQTDKVNDVVSS